MQILFLLQAQLLYDCEVCTFPKCEHTPNYGQSHLETTPRNLRAFLPSQCDADSAVEDSKIETWHKYQHIIESQISRKTWPHGRKEDREFMTITCSGEKFEDELRSCVPCLTWVPAVQCPLLLNQP